MGNSTTKWAGLTEWDVEYLIMEIVYLRKSAQRLQDAIDHIGHMLLIPSGSNISFEAICNPPPGEDVAGEDMSKE